EPSDFTAPIAQFKQMYPHINVEIKKLRLEEFEDTLIRALAEGAGPDIISIQTSWLKQYQKLIDPMPASVTVPATLFDGKQTYTSLQTTKMPTLVDLRNNYIDTVSEDMAIGSTIYGLPLGVDTLVMYYNRQMLNQANITEPARTWEEFKDQIKLLTYQDKNGNILQSGATIGGASNINRASDILAVLMMQNGTEMESGGKVAFNQVPTGLKDDSVVPGRDALRFYTDFSSPAKEVYTWNENMPESLNAFANQQSAYFFGYSYHLPLIRSLGSGVDLGIAKLPQISTTGRQVNIANYWMESVVKQSSYKNEAWAFLQFITSQTGATQFLSASGKPTALRALIASQRSSEELKPFADQLLTSSSWYHGKDANAMENAFRFMISQIIDGSKTPEQAINDAAQTINLTY
ncbi:MAG: hypothetical protein COY02_00060, partial [Parcubacteria group bacterium CG_4_10_14_0_2_um_filter_41_6]